MHIQCIQAKRPNKAFIALRAFLFFILMILQLYFVTIVTYAFVLKVKERYQ